MAGLDVHKATVVACVRIMSAGKAKCECRTFGTTTAELEALRDWITSWECTREAMEATGVYWLPIWKILLGGAFEMNIANARHIKAVPGRKTDMNDAMWIADLAAYGLIRATSRSSTVFHLGAAHADADAQAARARSDQPRPAHPEDADRGQHPPGSR